MSLFAWDSALAVDQQRQEEETTPDTFSCLAVSPDGRLMAVGSIARYFDRGGVYLSRVDDGEGVWIHDCEPVLAVAFSPDSRLVATAHQGLRSEYGLIRLWDAGSGKAVRTLLGHHGPANSVCFSPDGRSVISAGSSRSHRGRPHGEIIVWEVGSGTRRLVVEEKDGAVTSVTVSADGEQIAGVVRLNEMQWATRLWSLAGRVLARTLTKHPARIDRISFSTNEHELAVGGPSVAVPGSIGAPYSADLGFSIGGYQWSGGTLALIDAGSGKVLWTERDFKGPVNKMAFSADGRQLAAVADILEWKHLPMRSWPVKIGSEWRILDTGSGQQRLVQAAESIDEGIAFVPGRQEFITCTSDNAVRIWDSDSGRLKRALKKTRGLPTAPAFKPSVLQTSWPVALAFLPGLKGILSVRRDAVFQSWDLTSSREDFREGGKGSYSSAAFSPDTSMLATSRDVPVTAIEVRRLDTKVRPAKLRTPEKVVRLVFLSSETVLVAFESGRTELFDIPSRSMAFLLNAGEKACFAACSTVREMNGIGAVAGPGTNDPATPPDFVTGHPDGTVRFWDLRGHALLSRNIQPSGLTALAVSGKTDAFYTGDELGAVKSWSFPTMRVRRTFRSGGGAVSHLCLSGSERFLAAADTNNLVTLWDTVEKRELMKLELDLAVGSLAFSADSSLLAVGCWNNQIMLVGTADLHLLNILRN